MRGLIYWDEAKFALEGIRMQAAWGALFGLHVNSVAGKAIGTAKPGHALLIAISYGIVGIHDYAPLYLNATAGVLQVLVLFFVVRWLFSRGPPSVSSPLSVNGVALLASLLLAVSEYDSVYARSALSESDGNLIFLLGVLALVVVLKSPGRHRWLYLMAGLLFGISFTVNYRLVVYIGVACAFVFLWTVKESRRIPWSAAALLPGLIAAPVLWQLAGTVAQTHGFLLFADELTGRPTSYLAEVAYQLHGGKQSIIHFQPLPYLQWYLLRQGWVASILLIAGLVIAVRARTVFWLFPATMVIVPYIAYVFAPFNVPRNLDTALPFTALLSASALCSLVYWVQGLNRQRVAIGLAALALAVLGLRLSWRLTDVRSGFSQAASYVRVHDRGMALTSTELMTFYLGGSTPNCGAPALPLTKAGLASAIADGYEFAVTERHGTKVTHFINLHAPKRAHFLALGVVNLGESLISSENGDPPESTEKPEWVNVYWLPGLHLDEKPARPVPCPPNHVI